MTLSKDAASCQHLGMLQNKKKKSQNKTNKPNAKEGSRPRLKELAA